MSMICYVPKRFGATAESVITYANEMVEDYAADGIRPTLRQIYYRFVARDLFPDDRRWTWTGTKWVRDPEGTKNADPNYFWLGDIISDARLAGRVDWDAVVDLTRELTANSHWTSPRSIVETCVKQYQIDKWAVQPNYVEVWIEKDALASVFEPICRELDVPLFSCRGYTSQSAMWQAGRRLRDKQFVHDDNDRAIQRPVWILHFGDHDPSGIDMTRDIEDRLTMFMAATPDDVANGYETEQDGEVTVERIALNRDQIRKFNPPPNPAKVTDSRARAYIREHGTSSWELDALEPRVLMQLISSSVIDLRDEAKWSSAVAKETRHREQLRKVIPELDQR